MVTVSRAPTSDEAVSGSWTGSAGSRYTLVDDYPDTTGADKLTHGTTAGNITFGFTAFAIPSGSSNISVSVLYYDDKNGTGACQVGARLKVGGNYYNAATHNPVNGVFTQRTDSWATNPKTGVAWTVDDINGVGANALQAFGWNSTDASPTIDLTSIQLDVTYSPPDRRAEVSFAELEIPNAPRRAEVSFAELEVPTAPRRAEVSFAEFEVPTAPRRAEVSFAEMEVPNAPRRAEISFAELELPEPGQYQGTPRSRRSRQDRWPGNGHGIMPSQRSMTTWSRGMGA